MDPRALDDLDRLILRELVAHGRLSNTALAERLPLSHSAISRRISRMEASGVIKGYSVNIDPAALGVTIRVFIGVRRHPAGNVQRMAEQLQLVPGVARCWIVTGEQDYLLDVQAADMDALSDILLNGIQQVKGVVSTVSTFVLAELPTTG